MNSKIKFEAWVVDEYKEDGNTPKNFKMIHWYPRFFSDMSPVTRWDGYFPESSEDSDVILRQYVGINDIDGKEYYWGDIGEFENGDRFFISCMDWISYHAVWIGEVKEECQIQDFWEICHAKKIGNAFENPELMKGEKLI